MKKVLISAYTCCPNSGSEPGNGWNWLMGYLNNQYAVHCITSSKYRNKIETFRLKNNLQNITFYYTDNKITINLLKVPVIGIYIHYYAWLINARHIIKTLITKINFTSAHHVTYSSIKFGTPIYNLNFKSILGPLGGSELPHSSLKVYLGTSFYTLWIKNKFGHLLSILNPSVKQSVKSADLILISNQIAQNTINRYTAKKPVRMFDAGLNDYFEQPFYKKDVSKRIFLLWVGRIMPRKGLNLAIKAIYHLPDNFDFHFSIVGDGEIKNKAVKLVKYLNLGDKVTFLGKIPNDELYNIYKKSHILLFPSLIDSCPMQVFEAFAFGLPVVTLDHQGMKEQVNEERGKKILIGSGINYPVELAQAILSVCKSNEIFQSFSSHAYQFGQDQIWKKRINKFLE